jgi:hypothetical protein
VGYLAEHEVQYIGESTAIGSAAAAALGFWRRSHNAATKVEHWALFGAVAGLWFSLWIVLFTDLT